MKRGASILLVACLLSVAGCSKPSPEEKWVSGVPESQMGALCATIITQFHSRDAYIEYWKGGYASVPAAAKDLDPGLLYDAVMERCS